MTLIEKLQAIERHFNLWVETFNRKKPDVTTNARKTIEAICRAAILNCEGDIIGTQIIHGKYLDSPKIPLNRLGKNQTGELDLQNLIHCISYEELKIIKDNAIRNQFEVIRKLGNDGSHDERQADQIVTWDDMESCHYSLKPIIKWFYTEVLKQNIPISIQSALNGNPDVAQLSEPTEKWQEFFLACQDFERGVQYILVSPASLSENLDVVESFVKLPWRLVIDFNPKTDEIENGLLYQFIKLKGAGYQKSFTVDTPKADFDPDFPHHWFLANGQGNIEQITDFKLWFKRYKKAIENLYKSFITGSRPKSRVVVLIGIAPNYSDTIIDEFNRLDENNLRFIICPNNSDSHSYTIDRYDNIALINISPEEIAEGINNSINFKSTDTPAIRNILIPTRREGKSSAYLSVTQDHFDYLHTLGIDVIFKGIENSLIGNPDEYAFYKGATISWRDLYESRDLNRSATENLKKRLQGELEKNRLQKIEFVHEAGSGGTTLARRLAYDFSTEYPTVVIHRYEAKKTIGGLRILIDQYTKGSLPLLIVLEVFEVRDYQNLYGDLSSDHKNAVILAVRRGNVDFVKDKKFILRAQLDSRELPNFRNHFSLLVPARKQYVENVELDNKDTPKYISPVLYAITAYGSSYNIDGYVLQSLRETGNEHKELVGFICLIYHFTQRPVPAELFTTLLKVDRSKCNLNDIVKNSLILDLLHEEWEGDNNLNIWRPRYSIVGDKAMRMILGGQGTEENWENNLARWLLNLINYISTAIPFLDDETKQILLSLFIKRSGNDEIYEQDFTDAIIRLKSITNGTAVFETLTDAYSNEEAFHAHFARYLYEKAEDYNRAIIEAELSLDIQISSTLTHTLGMCYRKKAEKITREYESMGLSDEEAEDEVKRLTDRAHDIFEDCIEQDSKNIYGYESAIRVILTAIEFGFKTHKATSRDTFLTNTQNQWYSEKLDKANLLLEDALFVIEQSRTMDDKDSFIKSANYVYDCERRLYTILGDHGRAKNKYENLVKNTPQGFQYLRPLYRRMYVTHLLYSKLPTPTPASRHDVSFAWSKISDSELNECINFLKANFLEDASNPQNIKLWLQAIRHLKNPPSIDACLPEVSAWAQNIQQSVNSQLEGYYYAYVLNAIKSIQSGSFSSSGIQIVKEVREKISKLPSRKNEKFCFEWFGKGKGIQQMVNYKVLGKYDKDFFIKNKDILFETTGRIKDIVSPQAGTITLDCGLEAFFVPSYSSFTERNKGNIVKFYVGFRYDQIQAWSVVLKDNDRDNIHSQQEIVEVENLLDGKQEENVHTSQQVISVDDTAVQSPKLSGLKILGKIDVSTYKPKYKK